MIQINDTTCIAGRHVVAIRACYGGIEVTTTQGTFRADCELDEDGMPTAKAMPSLAQQIENDK